MIHILVDWKDGNSFFLKKELYKINIKTNIYDIPNYNIKDRVIKWRLPILYLKYIFVANRIIKKSAENDLIICWNFTTSIAVGYLCKLYNKKRKILALNIIAHKKKGLAEKMRRFLFSPVMNMPGFFITVNSYQYVTDYSNRFNVKKTKFFELNDPIQDEKIEPYEFNNSYVFVGGEAKRDWETLFNSAKLLPEINFICIAREKYFNKKLVIPNNIKMYFDTPKNTFYKKMKESSLVVIPLSSELPAGLIILLKATFINKPIIATNTPSIRNYVTNEFSGYLVPMGDHFELAKAIKSLYYDFGKQKLFTKNSLNYISKEFSKEKYTKKLSNIIKEINSQNSQ